MKNILTILIAILSITQSFSQKNKEKCVAKKENFVDVHALDINKCKVLKTLNKKKSSAINTNNISAKRYLKKRVYLNKVVHLASNLTNKKVQNIKTNNKINTDLLKILKEASSKQYVEFDMVENIPLFQSCNQNLSDKIECFNQQMEKHIIDNFKYPKQALKKGIEANLEVSFIIDKNGEIDNINIKSDNNQAKNNEVLIKEAKRIVSLLPKFTAGTQKGINVNVMYKFPMNFTLN